MNQMLKSGYGLARLQRYPALEYRCPGCAIVVVGVPAIHDIPDWRPASPPVNVPGDGLGWRSCPKQTCRTIVAVQYTYLTEDSGTVVTTWPTALVPLAAGSLPPQITECMLEATKCHSIGCNRAASAMLRRTLEVVCEEQEATGKTLKERLAHLNKNVSLPEGLFDGLDLIKLLGNDAVHVELKTFDSIGPAHVGLGIEIVNHLLGSLYGAIEVRKKLEALRKKQE